MGEALSGGSKGVKNYGISTKELLIRDISGLVHGFFAYRWDDTEGVDYRL
jgi:hypothetical protein